MTRLWTLLVSLAIVTPAWVQVYFTDNFESYTRQFVTIPDCAPGNTNPLELYDNPCDTTDSIWRTFDVWHGVPAPPNLQLVNTASPYPHPDPCFPGSFCQFLDPYLTQADPIPAARSGVQMLWAPNTGSRTQFVNLSAAAPGGASSENPFGLGAYFDFWFYDDDAFGKSSRSMAEARSYSALNAGVPATGLLQIYSLGPYDGDTNLSNRHYNIRGDLTGGFAPPDMANPRLWANFRQVHRSTGWHHAAIWLSQDDQGVERVTYIVDGIMRHAPRNPAHRLTTPVLRHLNDTTSTARGIYYDDVEVGVGTPPALSKAMFVGRVLPSDWRNDANGYLDVGEWIVDIDILDSNGNLLKTIERRLPKKNPDFNSTDGTDDYTGLIGIPNYFPDGTYTLRFTLRGRHWACASITITTPSRGEIVVLANGDVSLDGRIDDSDLLAVLFAFGSVGENLPEDMNADGVVDDADLLIVLFSFGAGC